jgi:hypothetical protein
MGIDGNKDIASSASIATIWTTTGNMLFPAEADHPIAAVAAADIDFCLVIKHI